MKYLRKLHDWVLDWAEKAAVPKALAKILFTEVSFFPIPLDVLLISIDGKIFQS